jgi:hypothetical protein
VRGARTSEKGRHAQGLENRADATAMPAPHDKNSLKHIITPRSTLIQNRATAKCTSTGIGIGRYKWNLRGFLRTGRPV